MTSPERRDRCCRSSRNLSWSTADSVLLVVAIISGCVLVTTVLVVWNPYDEISSFRSAQCLVISLLVKDNDPRTCTTSNAFGSSCVIDTRAAYSAITDNITVASLTENFTLSSTSVTPSNTLMDVTTGSTSGRRQCPSFPCSQIWVHYSMTYNDEVTLGQAQLYSNYTELQTYPGCSYSACDGATYSENYASIVAVVNEWSTKLRLGKEFNCFVNHDSSAVLEYVPYSWSQAFHSIFWPSVVGGLCLLTLTFHLLFTNLTSCQLGSKSRDQTADTDDPEPPIHRNQNMTSSAGSWIEIASDSVDFYGVHPVDHNYAALFDPPPYWQLSPSSGVSYDNVLMARRPSTDPPTYRQVTVEKMTEVGANNTITESSVF